MFPPPQPFPPFIDTLIPVRIPPAEFPPFPSPLQDINELPPPTTTVEETPPLTAVPAALESPAVRELHVVGGQLVGVEVAGGDGRPALADTTAATAAAMAAVFAS